MAWAAFKSVVPLCILAFGFTGIVFLDKDPTGHTDVSMLTILICAAFVIEFPAYLTGQSLACWLAALL